MEAEDASAATTGAVDSDLHAVPGLGFRVEGLGCNRVQGLGFRVELGFRV